MYRNVSKQISAYVSKVLELFLLNNITFVIFLFLIKIFNKKTKTERWTYRRERVGRRREWARTCSWYSESIERTASGRVLREGARGELSRERRTMCDDGGGAPLADTAATTHHATASVHVTHGLRTTGHRSPITFYLLADPPQAPTTVDHPTVPTFFPYQKSGNQNFRWRVLKGWVLRGGYHNDNPYSQKHRLPWTNVHP